LHLLSSVGLEVCGKHARPALLALQQLFGHRLVLRRSPVSPLLEDLVQLLVFLVFRTLYEA
jgi:hypothetical protein